MVGTFILYLIVISLLVMIYLLWEIRMGMTKQNVFFSHMTHQLGEIVQIQRSLAPGVAGDVGDSWPNNED